MSGLTERANQYIEHSKTLETFEPAVGEFYEGDSGLCFILNKSEYLAIDKDVWDSWSEKVRNLFKVTFVGLCEVGIEILDDNTMPMPRQEFQVMAFNAAVIAATSLEVIEEGTPGPKLCECI